MAQSLGLSQGAVHGYVARARRVGLSWPLPEELDDSQLEALLYPPPPAVATEQRAVPVAACDEATRCEERLCQIDAHGTTDEACAATTDAWDRGFAGIAETPATTLAGLRAKAKTLQVAILREATYRSRCLRLDNLNLENVREHLDPDVRIALSLSVDVLAMGSAVA